MYAEAVDDDILDELYGYACSSGNVNLVPPAIDGLITGHYQLLAQFDHHAMSKYNPQRPLLDDGVAERAALWVHHIIVRGVCDDVVGSSLASDGSPAKPEDAPG
ncbi:hypothetical protein Syun_017735 [Stephania yunnanensis]|uniref:Uncharacterized protein n=1 Tax=Stephania yunnanensis TaxID=152371 RepID=A0AAP0J7L1_9MAGN